MHIRPITYDFHLGETRGSLKELICRSGSIMPRTTFSIIIRALYPMGNKIPTAFGFKGSARLQLFEVRSDGVLNIERMCPKPPLHKGLTRAKPCGPALLQPDEPHTQSNPRDNYIN